MGYTKVLKQINGELFENCGEIMVSRHHDNFAFLCYHCCDESNVFLDLVDFVNHLQSQHVSSLEDVSFLEEDDDDIDVDDFVLDIKEAAEEAEYIDDDFDVQLTEEYIEGDYDLKPHEESVEIIDDDVDIKLIRRETEASTAASTADIEDDMQTSLYEVNFVGNGALSATKVSHTKKQSTSESKKAVGRQVQKPPVLIAPKPPATATLSAMGGINLSPGLKATLDSRRITIAQPKALLTAQTQEAKQFESKPDDTDAGEIHSTFYDLQFIDTGIMPPEPEPAANLDAPQTQLHAGKLVMPDKKSEPRVILHSAVGQQKIRISDPRRLLANAPAAPKKRAQVTGAGKPPRQIFEQASSSVAHRQSEQKVKRENSTNEVYVKIDSDDDALSSAETYDKLITEAENSKQSSPRQRILVTKRLSCMGVVLHPLNKKREAEMKLKSTPIITKVASTRESQNSDLIEFIAKKRKPENPILRRRVKHEDDEWKRWDSSSPESLVPDSKAGLDVHFQPLSPMKRNIIITKRIALPNRQANPRQFKAKPADNAPNSTKLALKQQGNQAMQPLKRRGRPRIRPRQSPILFDDNDDSNLGDNDGTDAVKKETQKEFMIVQPRRAINKGETLDTSDEVTNEETPESPSTGTMRRSNRTAVKKFVKYNQ